MGDGLRKRLDVCFSLNEKIIYAIYSGRGPKSEGGSQRGVGSQNGSGLRTRVDVFSLCKKGIYAIYSGKGPRSEGGSEGRVASEHVPPTGDFPL